jgi:hypothetical protein
MTPLPPSHDGAFEKRPERVSIRLVGPPTAMVQGARL